MKIKKLFVIMGCAVLLCGCTKSNIVKPDKKEAAEPDMNIYFNVEIDEDQLVDDVRDIYLDESDYPMAAGIDLELNEEEECVNITVVVKDDTSAEDASSYAETVVKGVNDEYCVQDYSFGESDVDTFGGLYQEREINLKIYKESAYEADGEPMYEVTVPKDVYMTFDIEE
ncbi:MAG: hypothetical protein ACI39W_11050 [Brotaphodocola sp.]